MRIVLENKVIYDDVYFVNNGEFGIEIYNKYVGDKIGWINLSKFVENYLKNEYKSDENQVIIKFKTEDNYDYPEGVCSSEMHNKLKNDIYKDSKGLISILVDWIWNYIIVAVPNSYRCENGTHKVNIDFNEVIKRMNSVLKDLKENGILTITKGKPNSRM